jgi:hypothetical protein
MISRHGLCVCIVGFLAIALIAAGAWPASADTTGAVAPANLGGPSPQDAARTATPIKHLVIIFSEDVSFDHYFATYPDATNPPGEPRFIAVSGTPRVNPNGTTGCQRSTHSVAVGQAVGDYIPHHNWFQYFASTANPTHAAHQHHRHHRLQLQARRNDAGSGEPPVRPAGFLQCGLGRQLPGGILHQAAGLPGRSRRPLRSAGRTGGYGGADQFPQAAG